jgi:hypothetical protein
MGLAGWDGDPSFPSCLGGPSSGNTARSHRKLWVPVPRMNTPSCGRRRRTRFWLNLGILLPSSWTISNGGVFDTWHSLLISLSVLHSFRMVTPLKIFLFDDFYPIAASTILGITYGYTPRGVDDEFIQLAHKATLESFRYGGPGSSVCDLVPFCMFCPSLDATQLSDGRESEALAHLDAVFLLSEARCLHEDDCGETLYSTTRMDRNTDGTYVPRLSCEPN